MSSKLSTMTAVALALYGAGASAADVSDMVSVRGYGTYGVVHSDQEYGDYNANGLQLGTPGAGRSSPWSSNVDTKFGLQADIKFNSKLSGVVQIVSESAQNNSWTGDPNTAYTPSLNWANLKYQMNDSLSFRVGRMVLPFNLISETSKVGYSYHFVRAPVEVYGQTPYTNFDGGDVTFKTNIAGATNTLVAFHGGQAVRYTTQGVLLKYQDVQTGFYDTLEFGSWLLRASYMHSEVKSPTMVYGGVFAGVAQLAQAVGQPAAAAAALRADSFDLGYKQSFNSFTVAATYDAGSWFAMSELVYVKTDKIVPGGTSGFVSGGYRAGAWTPYATFSRANSETNKLQLIPLAGLPQVFIAPGVTLGDTANGVITSLNNTDYSQQSLSAGVRWDFRKNFDLKVQYDYVDAATGAVGHFTNIDPVNFKLGSNANVFSVAVDFVF